MKKMLTMCEDATIKVRRLVHNFEERISDTQAQVWDEHMQMRPDFNFKDISVASLKDIILLHDWWAANAGGKTPTDVGMTEEEFKERGVNVVIYANQLTRTGFPAMQNAAKMILEHHRAKECDDICMPFKDIIRLIPEDI